MTKFLLVLLLPLTLLTGCGPVIVFGHTVGEGRVASENEPVAKHAAQPAPNASAAKIKSVTLALTPQATAKVASDPRFKADALLDAIESELQSRQLFDAHDPRASDQAEILIDDFATRSTSNAVVFGYNLSAGTLTGDIHVRGADGHELQTFKVVAESRLAIAASGEDANPLRDLYRRFANLAADDLAGTPAKSADASNNGVPR